MTRGLSCSTACGIFPDQGSNPYPLHWQADSQPLRHHGSPSAHFLSALFVFLVFIELHELHEINPLSVASFANIFSYSENEIRTLPNTIHKNKLKMDYLFKDHFFLSTYYMPDAIPGTGDKTESKTSAFRSLHSHGEKDNKRIYK